MRVFCLFPGWKGPKTNGGEDDDEDDDVVDREEEEEEDGVDEISRDIGFGD